MAKDRQEQFLEYLQETGVLGMLTKSVVNLYNVKLLQTCAYEIMIICRSIYNYAPEHIPNMLIIFRHLFSSYFQTCVCMHNVDQR